MRHTYVIVLVVIAAVTALLLYINSNIAVAQSELSKDELDAIIFGNGTTPAPAPAPELTNSTPVAPQTIEGFSLYQNELFGFTIQYPSYWRIDERNQQEPIIPESK